jgi:hypothetical protein
MATSVKLKIGNLKSLTKVQTVGLSAKDLPKVKGNYVISAAALKQLGLSAKDLKDLKDAEVLRPHEVLTCGDYNV